MLDGGGMADIRAQSRQGRRFTQHCRVQQAFIVWWRYGKTVKNLHESIKASYGVVCGNKQIIVA